MIVSILFVFLVSQLSQAIITPQLKFTRLPASDSTRYITALQKNVPFTFCIRNKPAWHELLCGPTIQNYYWSQICNIIGKAFKPISEDEVKYVSLFDGVEHFSLEFQIANYTKVAFRYPYRQYTMDEYKSEIDAYGEKLLKIIGEDHRNTCYAIIVPVLKDKGKKGLQFYEKKEDLMFTTYGLYQLYVQLTKNSGYSKKFRIYYNKNREDWETKLDSIGLELSNQINRI